MKTGTGRTKYGHKREGNPGHGKHRSDKYTVKKKESWANLNVYGRNQKIMSNLNIW